MVQQRVHMLCGWNEKLALVMTIRVRHHHIFNQKNVFAQILQQCVERSYGVGCQLPPSINRIQGISHTATVILRTASERCNYLAIGRQTVYILYRLHFVQHCNNNYHNTIALEWNYKLV